MFSEVQRQTVGQQAAGHAGHREPDTVQAIFRSPVRAAGVEDPFVEEKPEGVTLEEEVCQ